MAGSTLARLPEIRLAYLHEVAEPDVCRLAPHLVKDFPGTGHVLNGINIGTTCQQGEHCVALAEGGRGKKGGLSAYAEKVGKDESFIRQLRSAAKVAVKVGLESEVSLSDKAKHLAAIHALPETCWPAAVELMLAGEWTAKETADRGQARGRGRAEGRRGEPAGDSRGAGS